MAFLFNGGPECAPGAANPLSQALKGFNSDAALQRDLLSSRPVAGPSQFRHDQQQQQPGASQEDAEQFFARQGGPAFDLREVRQQLNEAERYSDWDRRFNATSQAGPQAEGPSGREVWAQDFQAHAQQQQGPTVSQAGPQVYQPRMNMTNRFNMGMGMRPSFSPSFAPPTEVQVDKGKGRFVELSDSQWESEFAKLDQGDLVNLASPTEREEAEDEDLLKKEIDRTWRNMQKQMDDQSAMDAEMSAWESQFGTTLNDQGEYMPQVDKFDLDKLMQEKKEWTYAEDNQMRDVADPFEEGKRLLHAGAPLTHVAQAFEEACRRDEGRAEAWLALGDTLAADEKETLSIAALEQAVALPGRGGESAWLSLAIAYINEGYDSRALSVLEQWIQRCYPDSYNPLSSTELDPLNPWASQQRITDMFLNAARAGPATRKTDAERQMGAIDADVQVGLGVLFYGNSDYGFAKDCFEAALSDRPKDWILWNRLGATLANGGHPEEAISAYRTALDLRPNFPRSLYNLAVSCLNINCFKEAAEHLLAAIELQGPQAEGSGSDNLWSTLRRSFFCMDRPDLAEKAVAGGDIQALKTALA